MLISEDYTKTDLSTSYSRVWNNDHAIFLEILRYQKVDYFSKRGCLLLLDMISFGFFMVAFVRVDPLK